jgi:hypothetical protein
MYLYASFLSRVYFKPKKASVSSASLVLIKKETDFGFGDCPAMIKTIKIPGLQKILDNCPKIACSHPM